MGLREAHPIAIGSQRKVVNRRLHPRESVQTSLGQSGELCLAPWALAQDLVSPIRLHFFPFPAFGLSTQAAETQSRLAVELA